MRRPLFLQAAGLVVSASDDATLRVWRLPDGACLRTLEGHTANIYSVVDVGGGRMASGGGDGTLRVWDALSGQQLQQILIAAEKAEKKEVLGEDGMMMLDEDALSSVWRRSQAIALPPRRSDAGRFDCGGWARAAGRRARLWGTRLS